MSVTKRIFNNLSWIVLSEVISRGLTFLGTVYLARVLGKEGFGLYSLAMAVGIYFWAFCDMGVAGYGTREVAKKKENAIELYSILNSLRLMLAVILFLVFCGVLYFINIPLEKKLILIAGCFYIVTYSFTSDWIFWGLEKMQYLVFGSVASALLFLIGIFIYVKSPSGVLKASFIYSFSFLIESLILTVLLKQKLKIPFSFRITFNKWRQHVKESFYFAINSAFNSVSIFIPILFLGIWSTAEDLGRFSAPQRLGVLIARAVGLITMALYPVFSNLYATDIDAFKKTHSRFQKILILISLPICIIAAMFNKNVITFIFGADYSDSAGIFTILVWYSLLLLLRSSFGTAVLSAGFQRFNMFATAVGVAINILICIVFIPRYSSYAATWALVAGEIATLILMIELFRRKLHESEFLRLYLVKILFIGLIMGVVIKSTHFQLIIGAISGILVYIFLSYFMGIVSKKEIQKIYETFIYRKAT